MSRAAHLDDLQHDLAALNIHIEDKHPDDVMRGYGLDTNQYTETYFDGNDMDGVDEDDDGPYAYAAGRGEIGGSEEELDDRPPEMPHEFYNEIDSFLNKPPPTLGRAPLEGGHSGNGSGGGSNEKKKKKKAKVSPDGGPPQLPPAAAAGGGGGGNNGDSKSKKQVTGKVYAATSAASGAAPAQRMIDPQLLREAFEYTDKLMRDAAYEDALDQQHQQQQNQQRGAKSSTGAVTSNALSRKFAEAYGAGVRQAQADLMMPPPQPRSAPADLMPHHKKAASSSSSANKPGGSGASTAGAGGAGGGGMGAVKMVRNLKQRIEGAPRKPNEDFVVLREAETDLKRNPVDFDTMLSNFQSGATLDKLRKELAESQQSLAQSEDVVRKLTGLRNLGAGNAHNKRK